MMTNVLPIEEGGKNLQNYSTWKCRWFCPAIADFPPGSLSLLSFGKSTFKIGTCFQNALTKKPKPVVLLTFALCCQSLVVSKMTPKCQNPNE